MAYDEGLAQRIREALEEREDVSEKKMFGGLAFLLGGNMSVGIVGDELMVRVGPDAWASALAQPHAREMDFTGRAMKGFVYVAAEGVEDDGDLHGWVERGVAFAGSLPPK
ncbi:MAG TPA: TfoX/Sxy family protein [Myxococcota bacterium]|nr:TfoX/Sxy family protein [Myxococcota bacterium]